MSYKYVTSDQKLFSAIRLRIQYRFIFYNIHSAVVRLDLIIISSTTRWHAYAKFRQTIRDDKKKKKKQTSFLFRQLLRLIPASILGDDDRLLVRSRRRDGVCPAALRLWCRILLSMYYTPYLCALWPVSFFFFTFLFLVFSLSLSLSICRYMRNANSANEETANTVPRDR